MRRILFLLVTGLVQTMLLAGTAWAQDMSFSDDFDSFDTARWSKGDHMLGRSYLDPTNVGVGGGNLQIQLPARTLEGGEVYTSSPLGYGSYSANIKAPYAPGSITGFFLYKAPDYESEIDVEIYNDSTRRIILSTYAGGRQTHTETLPLPFDPTTAFHEYRFDYSPGSLTFYADGKSLRTWNDGIPQTSMHLMLNSWFPRWLDGRRPKKTAYTYVDRIGFAAQPVTQQ